jgi:elongation factor Ts
MAITASLVKELRERTGAGMMECKKALTETNGDIEAAIENMRKSGQAKAAKKAGRTAADGVIVIGAPKVRGQSMVEVNCETDFVAKDDNFKSFADAVGERALHSEVSEVQDLLAMPLHEGEDTTIEEARQALVSKIGENMNVRRFVATAGAGRRSQLQPRRAHRRAGRYQSAVTRPWVATWRCTSRRPTQSASARRRCRPDLIAKEREITKAQARESGKPDNIVEKMVEGRMRKFLAESTLTRSGLRQGPRHDRG